MQPGLPLSFPVCLSFYSGLSPPGKQSQNYAVFDRKINTLGAGPPAPTRAAAAITARYSYLTSVPRCHFIVGMENSAPSFTPDGQREVTVLVRV